MKTKVVIISILFLMSHNISAQDNNELNVSIGADFATSYIWRGLPQGTMPALQPWGECSFKGFTLGTWGSYEVAGNFKEIDVYAKYTLQNFTVQFIDLFFPDYVGLNQDYFNFKKGTGHGAELGLSFNGTEKIPFSVYCGMIIYGAAIDPKTNDASRLNNSIYMEVNYFGNFKDISYNVFAGLTPSESVLYNTTQFSVFNVGLSVKKAVQLTEKFSLPLKLTLSANPVNNKLYMAVLVSL
jgi:hypothetical protein